MGRALSRLVAVAGWALLGALALLGVAISAVVGLSASSFGRPLVAGFVIRQVDEALAGRLELEALEVLPQGGIELRGLQVYDPEERLVLQVSRVRLFPDLTRLSREEVGVVLELDQPSVLLETDADGGVSLARAFAPAHPALATARPPGAPPTRPSWTLRLTQLIVRGGDLWWQRADRSTAAEVTGLRIDAEGAYGPAGGFLGLRVSAAVSAPVEAPLSLEVAARLAGDRVEVPVLKGALGPTGLEALARGDLARRTFRAAVTRLSVRAADARRLAPEAALGGDLSATAYAESDGHLATAALEARPVDGAPGGAARVAAAARVPPDATAIGFDVALAGLDPSRLVAQAPPGRVTLTARGAAAGTGLADGRGRLALELAPSRLREGELGPASVMARADRGLLEVGRLEARLPGVAVTGRARWREGGPVEGTLTVDADDLGRLGRNLVALTGSSLPALAGRLRAGATLSGTSAAPAATATLEAPRLVVGGARLEAVKVAAEGAGPLARARARLSGSAARALVGSAEVRHPELAAGFADDEATLSISGVLPELGRDPVALAGAALVARDRRSAEVRELSLGWPGARFALARPAAVTFAPPSVDRLELVDGPRRLAVSGGLRGRDELDARLEVTRLDLARLPRGLLPPDAGVAGELSLDARASGTTRRPTLRAHLTLAGGEARGLTGLQLLGDVAWDGAAGRLSADVGLVRTAGGTLDVAADLPLPLERARPREPVTLTVGAAGWPVVALRQAAGVEAPVTGTVGAQLALSGTVAAPALKGAVTLEEASLEDLGPLGAAVTLEQVGDAARLTVKSRLAGAPLLTADLHLPLDLAGLLQRPEGASRALSTAALTGALEVPGLELAAVAGKAGLPEGLSGTLTASAALGGTPAAPRGRGTLAVSGAAAAGYRDLAARVEAAAEPGRTSLVVRASIGGAEALRLDGSLGAAVERLADPAGLRAAPLALEATVPALPLARAAGAALPLTGTLTGRLAVQGTLARPEGRLDLAGAGVEVEGRPLGDLTAVARYQAASATAELSFRPAAGGVLWAGATLAAPLGLDTDPAALRQAPATLRVTSDRLDLGFLPAVAPGLVRTAGGPLTVDLTATGPLEGLRPRGTIKLADGRVAVAELGEWTELTLDASLGQRAIEVARLGARRGRGRLAGNFSMRDLGTPVARLDGRLSFQQFTISRAGMELATLDLPLELKGTMSDDLLDTTLSTTGGTIRLPKKTPRELQSLESRKDITVGRVRGRRGWFGAAPEPAGAGKPFEARCRVLVPGKLFVKSESPTLDVEVKGDTTWTLVGGELLAEGPMEVVRGMVEPISGRVFHLERGKITFTGAGWKAGQLDVVARYDNPAAQVTVTIGGAVLEPSIRLSSRPPMDDAAIAMLIATGRTEIKANTSEVGTLTGKEAGMAAAGAAVSVAFKELVAGKLPIDQVSLDASTLRAGKYLTDKLFVGYTRRFEARPDQGENVNEVKAEYQISPRWNFELRYGDAQAGDASLIWTKDY